MKSKLIVATLVLFLAAAVLAVGNYYGLFAVPGPGLMAVRWLAIVALFGYGLARRNLTTWIVVAMVAGAEIGHDWPAFGTSLRVVSMIFLRTVKVIIAPLLFATLVSGIASHSVLR